jgi:ABC-type transport system involved in multi-copper enzyme maturation permease subunit
MSLERGIPDYWQWLLGHPTDSRLFQPETWGFLWGALAICFLLLLITPFLSFVIASFQYGPAEAFYYVARAMFTAVTDDLPRFSLRRTLAVSRLAIQEAIRNRVLIGFGVFIVLLLVAGMFLDAKNSNPARVYLSFVLVTTNYLVLLMALFLSTFSIPNDIKNRTIYTVVTKPIRAGEIVLGRTLGFLAVGTVMLVLMGLISYGFVRMNLYHDHALAVADLVEETLPNSTVKVRKGRTSEDKYHRHTVTIGADGKGQTDVVNGHWHEAEIVGDQVVIGPPKGDLIARAPVYGQLVILDREGKVIPKGINVGNEWDYRGFIEGGPPGGISKAAAIWTFSGVSAEKYPNGLPLELTIRVFRSYKGDIEQGVLGEIVIRNPDPSARIKRSGPILFTSKEYLADYHLIPRELNSESGSNAGKIDLFNDLVSSDGRVEVEVRCVEPAQYFGMAQADAYLRPADSTFELNFAKAYLSIWLQMVLVTCLGVTLSTFLSGPVAMMATLSIVVMGFFGQFIRGVANGAVEGGGPIEAAIRILLQQNVMTEFDNQDSILIRIIEGLDAVLMRLLQAGTYALPDFTQFDTVMFVADGYSIFPSLVGQQVTMALIYFVVVTIVGYFCLKSREIAA